MSDQNDRPGLDAEGVSEEPTVAPAEDVEAPETPAVPEHPGAPGAPKSPEIPDAPDAPEAPELREIDESHAATLDDGTVVRWESWRLGEEVKDGDKVRIPVVAEGAEVAEYVRVGPEEAIASAQGAWDLDVVGDGRLVATLPDGRVFTAGGKDRPKLARAKKIDVDLGGDRHLFVL